MAASSLRRDHAGFTMVQLLVVIFVVGIVAGLLIPAIRRTREDAARTQVVNNLKQLQWALISCNDAFKKLPPATGTFGQLTTNMPLSVHLLPYLESSPRYKSIVLGSKPAKNAVFSPFLAVQDFSQSDSQRVQNFAVNVRIFTQTGLKTSWDADVLPTGTHFDQYSETTLLKEIPDGVSATIVFSTRFANNTSSLPGGGNINCSAYDAHYLPGSTTTPFGAFFGAKTLPGPATALSTGGFQLAPTITQANCAPGELAHSFEKTGIMVGLADTSVRMLKANISSSVWNQAMCPHDGIPLENNWGD